MKITMRFWRNLFWAMQGANIQQRHGHRHDHDCGDCLDNYSHGEYTGERDDYYGDETGDMDY